jgi:molybdopterin converting factor small subunit
MSGSVRVKVKMLGCLHTLRREAGLPSVVEVDVPPEGRTGEELAEDLALPLERIEAVICNHRTHPLGHRIAPGDSVAFVPRGTPGPHRYTLGIYSAGKESGPSE